MVGVHVADDDPGQPARIEDALQSADDALADVEEDGRLLPLDEIPGGGRGGVGDGCAAAKHGDAQTAGHVGHRGIVRPGAATGRVFRDLAAVRAPTSAALVAGGDTMRNMLAPRPLVASIARIPFFAGLDQTALERVAAGTRSRRFRRGEVIFHSGDPGDGLFIIVSGQVKIGLPSETGDEAIIATLHAGDVFGELALLDGAPRSATATALEATETIVLPRDRFHELIATEPAFREALLASLAGELRRLTTHVEELHFLDMTGRLAARLVRLAEEARASTPGAEDDEGSIRLRATLTQAELASMVGCTRQSVNKLLGQFAVDGLVRLDRDGMTVTDLAGLVTTSRR
jgi:CRP/FNR family cyclic AMP-dependent transcriptional regulator